MNAKDTHFARLFEISENWTEQSDIKDIHILTTEGTELKHRGQKGVLISFIDIGKDGLY